MTQVLQIMTVVFFLVGGLQAQTSEVTTVKNLFAQSVNRSNQVELEKHYRDFEVLSINKRAFQSLNRSTSDELHLTLPSKKGDIHFDLKEEEVLPKGFKIYDGQDNEITLDLTIKSYRGKIEGQESSYANLVVTEDDVEIYYFDGSQGRKVMRTPVGDYINVSVNGKKGEEDFTCGSTEEVAEVPSELTNNLNRSSVSYSTTEMVAIHLELDYAFYQEAGDMQSAATWAAKLIANVSTFYQNAVNVKIMLGSLKIWNTPDPYNDGTTMSQALAAFGIQQNANGQTLVSFLASARRLKYAGLAYKSGPCVTTRSSTSSYGPYATAFIRPEFADYPTPSRINSVCHELGHVFGANHTHSCVWNLDGRSQIDDCGSKAFYLQSSSYRPSSCVDTTDFIIPDKGTMMSYCGLVKNDHGVKAPTDPSMGFSDGDGSRVGSGPRSLIRYNIVNARCDLMPSELVADITLKSFTARQEGNEVVVDWVTSEETDVAEIVLQKSIDAQNWTDLKVYEVYGDSKADKTYQYTDLQPNTDNYYRLKDIEISGTVNYSSIVQVKYAGSDDETIRINYDVASSTHTVEMIETETTASTYTVEIINSIGQIVLETEYNAGDYARIGHDDLIDGVYFIRVISGRTTKKEKFVKI